ncbi:MAG: hypothetical protein EBU31_15445 [Proteobacteria bacterium]|nr:hypothetical protein [Pseudomonadota bacterium]
MKTEKKPSPKKAVAKKVQEEEEEEIVVKRFEYKGVKYLKSPAGVIYDEESENEVGVWNEDTKEIDFLLINDPYDE